MALFYTCILIFLTLSFESMAEFRQDFVDYAKSQLSQKADSRRISMPVRIVEMLDQELLNVGVTGEQATNFADTIMLVVANGSLKKDQIAKKRSVLKPDERVIAIKALKNAFAQLKARRGMNDTNVLSGWLAGLVVDDETNEQYRNHKAIYAAIALGALDTISTPVILNHADDGNISPDTRSAKQVLANLKTTKPWLGEKLENPWYWYRADADAERQHWNFANKPLPSAFNIYDLNGNVVAGQAEADFFNWLARKESNLYKLDIGLFSGSSGVKGTALNQSSPGSRVPKGTSQFGRPCIGFYNAAEPFDIFQNTTAKTTGFWAPLVAPDGTFWDVTGVTSKEVTVSGREVKFYYFTNSEAYFQAHKAFVAKESVSKADKTAFIQKILKAGLTSNSGPATEAKYFGDKVDPDKWEGPMLAGQEEYDELTSISPYVYGRISGRGYKDLVMYRALMYKFRGHPAALAFLMATKGITKIEHTGSGPGPDLYWGDGLLNGQQFAQFPAVNPKKEANPTGYVGINTLGRYLTALGELFFSRPALIPIVNKKNFDADCDAIEMFGGANDKTVLALRELQRDGYYQALTAFITGRSTSLSVTPPQPTFGAYQVPVLSFLPPAYTRPVVVAPVVAPTRSGQVKDYQSEDLQKWGCVRDSSGGIWEVTKLDKSAGKQWTREVRHTVTFQVTKEKHDRSGKWIPAS